MDPLQIISQIADKENARLSQHKLNEAVPVEMRKRLDELLEKERTPGVEVELIELFRTGIIPNSLGVMENSIKAVNTALTVGEWIEALILLSQLSGMLMCIERTTFANAETALGDNFSTAMIEYVSSGFK